MDEREQMNQGETREPAPERAYRREQTAGSDSIAQAKRVLDLIEQKLSEGRRIPLSKGMAVVSVDEIGNLISQLRIALPKTVLQAQDIMQRSQQIMEDARRAAEETANQAETVYKKAVADANAFKESVQKEADDYDRATRQNAQSAADAMLADAKMRADQVLLAAQQNAQSMVEESEITRRAQAYAMETRERAEKDADSIYSQACVQTDKMLSGAAAALSRSASELAALRDSLLGQGQQNAR
ncbi:MAG: hypothetical protein PUH70_12695 [Clostridiales bacterium]|nr:hypothetical protein [Clostridiales bacterium]MDY5513368.1 hypothetical protein [Candidatus Ventricola sp.]